MDSFAQPGMARSVSFSWSDRGNGNQGLKVILAAGVGL